MKVQALYLSAIKTIIFSAVLFVLIGFSNIYAQSTPRLGVTVALKVKDGDLKNALVTITRKGEPFKILDPGKGETIVELPLGYEYQFSFTKLGYITQNVYIDTHVPENRENGTFRKQVFKVVLVKDREEDRQDVRLAYNMDIEDFDFIKGNSTKPNKIKPETTTTIKTKTDPVVVSQNPADTANQNKKPGSKIKDKKVLQQDTKKITTITIIIDDKEYIYKKEEYDWGGTFFYKNGLSITSDTFKSETEE